MSEANPRASATSAAAAVVHGELSCASPTAIVRVLQGTEPTDATTPRPGRVAGASRSPCASPLLVLLDLGSPESEDGTAPSSSPVQRLPPASAIYLDLAFAMAAESHLSLGLDPKVRSDYL